MVKLSRVFKDYQDSGALNALINIHAVIGPNTFVTKGGDLVTILRVRGIDDECLDAAEIDQTTHRFEATLRVFDEKFRVYQYLLKRDLANIPSRGYADAVVQAAVHNRIDHLNQRALHSIEIYWAVVYEGWRPTRTWREQFSRWFSKPQAVSRELLSTDQAVEILKQQIEQAEEFLMNRVKTLVIQLRDAIPVEILNADAAYGFLRRLVNYTPYKAETVGLKYDSFVDFQACDSLLECQRDHLRLDDHYVEVLTLKDPPAETFAHLFRGLQEIPANFIIATEWRRESNWHMRQVIRSKQRHFHNSKESMSTYVTSSSTTTGDALIDAGAAANVSDLGASVKELEMDGNYFGQFSMSVVLHDEDRSKLRRAAAEVFKVFATQGAQLTQERYNLLNAWLAVIPGNAVYNRRHLWLLNTNYADMAFLFQPRTGDQQNPHLRTEYLAVLETDQHTPFFANLHFQDVAHTIALGMTGSGKSFLMNFLLTQLQKYQPITFIFDLGGSYRSVTQLFKGAYVAVGLEDRPISINPFCLDPTEENLQFLFSFVKLLIEAGGGSVTGQDERDLYEQIENLYEIEPGQRRLGTLAQILNRKLSQPLTKWVAGGQFGSLFDNISDNLTFARFQAFDFGGIRNSPEVLEPLLFYVLHRASAVIADEKLATTFKVFLMDEAWLFLQHAKTKAYILEATKTWRKQNAAMILATQSTEDLLRSEMLAAVAESCPTKLFLANPGMDVAAYRDLFHLTQTEAELISRLIPKKQILLKRPDMAKVLNLNVDPKSYWLYTNDSYDNQKKQEAFERYGFEKGLEILVKEQLS
jgi:type IV secretion/conjugal transfer VirB4 family ATPase